MDDEWTLEVTESAQIDVVTVSGPETVTLEPGFYRVVSDLGYGGKEGIEVSGDSVRRHEPPKGTAARLIEGGRAKRHDG